MIKHSLARLSDYFFKPISPYPLALFRILVGLCACTTLLLLHNQWLAWFGVRGWVSMETIAKAETGFRVDLFALIPHDDRWIAAFFWLLLAASITLTAGLGTRLSTIVLYLGLNSLNQRNTLIFHGGDTLLRTVMFFLIFAPAGAALSLDRLLKLRKNHAPHTPAPPVSPWAQRLIQIQIAVVYLASFLWKLKGAPWRDGTALYYVLHLGEIRRFPIPAFFYQPWAFHTLSWITMLFELSFPLLIWFKPFRNPLLIIGILFHLSLEYTLNLPMFQWEMLCIYPLFLNGDLIERLSIAHPGKIKLAIRSSRENRAL